MLTQNRSENNIFSEKQSYRLLSPDVRLDLRYLAITLSGNLKIIRKVKKSPRKSGLEVVVLYRSRDRHCPRGHYIKRPHRSKHAHF